MIIGIPKEIKSQEYRVAFTPAAVRELTSAGHQIYIQTQAGHGSSFSDEDYRSVGAQILEHIEEVYEQSELILKVKEPLEAEYSLIKEGQIVFTFFHFASSQRLTSAMCASKSVCIAYETVTHGSSLVLLTPMSEVAGRMSIQQGAKYLERPFGGYGILLGGVAGVEAARVLILGGGIVGTEAAKMAAGLGADVTLLDRNINRLRHLSEVLPPNVRLLMSSTHIIERLISTHQLIVGAVLVQGAKAPRLITRNMLQGMQKGTVIVDVSVDQGGCFETTRATTHEHPTYETEGIIHYCVDNMPGAVPHTSTQALTHATLPYVINIANKGWQQACIDDPGLGEGLNIVEGQIVYPAISEALDMRHTSLDKVLHSNFPKA